MFLPGLPHRVGSDVTDCRGSDTLLLLNEANELELGLLGAGGGGPHVETISANKPRSYLLLTTELNVALVKEGWGVDRKWS